MQILVYLVGYVAMKLIYLLSAMSFNSASGIRTSFQIPVRKVPALE